METFNIGQNYDALFGCKYYIAVRERQGNEATVTEVRAIGDMDEWVAKKQVVEITPAGLHEIINIEDRRYISNFGAWYV